MTSPNVEELQDELVKLLGDEEFLNEEDLPQNLQLGIRVACLKARSALQPATEDLQRLRETTDPGDEMKQRQVKKKQKEVNNIQRICKLIEAIEASQSHRAAPISNTELRNQLSTIDQELLDRFGDRRHKENRIKDKKTSEQHRNRLKEELRQLMLTIREILCRKAHILKRNSVSAQLLEVDKTAANDLLQDTNSRIDCISQELSQVDAGNFPTSELKLETGDQYVRLENLQLLCFAHMASQIISRHSEFQNLFREAKQSCSSCKNDMEGILANIESNVLTNLQSLFSKSTLNLKPSTSTFEGLLKTKNYNKDTPCLWAVEHFRQLCFWECEPASVEADSRAIPFVACVKISMNLFKTPPEKEISVGRNSILFEKSKKSQNPYQVQLKSLSSGSKCLMIRQQPLYAWYFRKIEPMLESVFSTHAKSVEKSEKNPIFSCESCAWLRISKELELELNSKYLTCRREPFCCNLLPEQAVLWDVDFETMVASSRESSPNYPGIELKREEIGWFYCYLSDWTHLSEQCMRVCEEEWYQRGCQPDVFTVERIGIGFEIVKEADSMYFRFLTESSAKRKKLHRQILTSVQGQAFFSCATWPHRLIQMCEVSASRKSPCPEKALELVVDSLVSIDQKLVRHLEKDCECTKSPKYSKIKSQNYTDCYQACNKVIGKSLAASVEYFMFLFYGRILRLHTDKFAAVSQYDKCYKLCNACVPDHVVLNETERSHIDDSVMLDVESSDSFSVELVDYKENSAQHVTEDSSAVLVASSTFADSTNRCIFHPHVCQLAIEIRNCHKLLNPSWTNCTIGSWTCPDAHRHIAKLFCGSKHNGHKDPLEKFDASSLLSALYFCTDNALIDIDRDSCVKVKSVRNHNSHPPIENEQQLDCNDFYKSLCDIRKCMKSLFSSIFIKASDEQVCAFKAFLETRISHMREKLEKQALSHFRNQVSQAFNSRLFGLLDDRAKMLAHIDALREARSKQQKPPAPPDHAEQDERERYYRDISNYRCLRKYLDDCLNCSCELLSLIDCKAVQHVGLHDATTATR